MRSLASAKTQRSEQWRDYLAIGMVLLLAASFRMVNFLSQKVFWDDELFSVLLARKPFWEVLYGAIIDVHPPGHLILLHVFYLLFGDSDWVFRLPSVLAGVALVYVVYLLAQEFFEKKTALLASFLVAISPFFMQLSNEARSYSLAALVLTFTSYSFVKFSRTFDTRWRHLYTMSMIVSCYIDHFAWLLFFMVNVYLLLGSSLKRFFRCNLRILCYAFPALLLTVYQILFSSEQTVLAHQRLQLSFLAVVKTFFAVLWHAATGYGYSGLSKESLTVFFAEPLFWLTVVAYGALLTGVLFAMIKARRDVLMFVLLCSIAPVIFLCILYPTRLESRYVSFVVPQIFIFGAAGFTRLRYSWVGLLTLVVVSLYFSFKTLAMPWDPIHKEDYRAAIQHTFEVANEEDAVFGLDRQVQYYGPKKKRTHYYRTLENSNLHLHYEKIFLLEPALYVDPERDHKRLDRAQHLLGYFGYQLRDSVDFSKDGVYTFVHVFE